MVCVSNSIVDGPEKKEAALENRALEYIDKTPGPEEEEDDTHEGKAAMVFIFITPPLIA